MEVFLALFVLFVIGSCYLVYWLGKLIYLFFRWLLSPLLEEIEHRRILEQERQKEQRLLELHDRTRVAIDQTVANYVSLHQQATNQADSQSGRRQSG